MKRLHAAGADGGLDAREARAWTERLVAFERALRRMAREIECLRLGGVLYSRGCVRSDAAELASLSEREWDIVGLLMAGERVPNIALLFGISAHTVRNHLQSVFRKLGVGCQAELIEKLHGYVDHGHGARHG